MKYDKHGRELPDSTPVEVPLQFQMTPEELMHRRIMELMWNQQFAREIAAQGLETPEEADDFETEEDVDLPLTDAERAYLRSEELRVEREELEEERRRAIVASRRRADHGDEHGFDEGAEGDSGVGRVGETGKADGEPVSSASAGDRKKA